MDLYDLANEGILNSRDSSFLDKIRNLTNYRGVDIVLDPFLDERCEVSWECLAPLGRFLDISQGDFSGPKFPQTGFLNKNVSYSKIDLASMMLIQSDLVRETSSKASVLMSERLLQAPGPIRVFPASRVDDALRCISMSAERRSNGEDGINAFVWYGLADRRGCGPLVRDRDQG